MRRLLAVFTVILCSTAFAFAQGRDDHNDSGPILTGYGVVTPVAAATGGTITGLVAFESFGLRNGFGVTSQAGVLPADLTTNAILFVDTSGRLAKNLGVAIVNPNSSNVNVTLTLRNVTGSVLSTTIVNVPSHQQVSKYVTELFSSQSAVPSEVTGTLVLTSGSPTLPVAIMGLRFRGINFSTLPATSLSGPSAPMPIIATNVGGPGAILLPQFAGGGGWATEVVLVNNSPTALTVRVDLFRADGTPFLTALNNRIASSFTDLVIPPGGVFTLAPRNLQGDDDF